MKCRIARITAGCFRFSLLAVLLAACLVSAGAERDEDEQRYRLGPAASVYSAAGDRSFSAVSRTTWPLVSPSLMSNPRRSRRAVAVQSDVTTVVDTDPSAPWQPESSFLPASTVDSEQQARSDQQPGISDVLSNIISILGGNVRVLSGSDPPPDRTVPSRPPPSHHQQLQHQQHQQQQHQHQQHQHQQQQQHQRPQRPLRPQRPAKPSRINNRGPPQFLQPGKQQQPGRLPRPPLPPYVAAVPIPEQLVPQLLDQRPQIPLPPTQWPERPQFEIPEQLVPQQVDQLPETPKQLPERPPAPSPEIQSTSAIVIPPETTESESVRTRPTPQTTTTASTTAPPPTEKQEPLTTVVPVETVSEVSLASSRPEVPFIRPSVRPPQRVSTTSEAKPTGTSIRSSPSRHDHTASFVAILSSNTVKASFRPSVPLPPRAPSPSMRMSSPAPTASPVYTRPSSTIPPSVSTAVASSLAPSSSRQPPPRTQPTPAAEQLSTDQQHQSGMGPSSTIEWVEIPSTADVPVAPSSLEPTSGQPVLSLATATPPLLPPGRPGRPGVVLDAAGPRAPARRPMPSRTSALVPPLRIGETFDVTVLAAQGYGSGRPAVPKPNPTGQPYVIPVDINQLRQPGDIITQPDPTNRHVSIDGRRTYFNLDPTNAVRTGSFQTVGAGVGFGGDGGARPPASRPSRPSLRPPLPAATRATAAPTRRHHRPAGSSSNKMPYSSVRRRPSPPPIRIDTCIVGDDSTCKQDFHERCHTEDGISSCTCRPGYSRLRPRTTCKRVVSVVMSVKVDGVDDQRLSWDPVFSDPDTEAYQQLAWDSKNAINSAMSQTEMSDIYMGNAVNSFYSLGGRLIVNTTVRLVDTMQSRRPQVRQELQQQMLQVIRAKRNSIGDSSLYVEGPLNPIPGVQDFNECNDPKYNDCHEMARCDNVFGSFLCSCLSGYDDRYESDVTRAGRYCESCTDDYCSDHGVCRIHNGQKTCQCREPYYGTYCNVDGEVLGAALGATAAAAIVIIATFIGLCKWSKRWHKSQHQNKLEMGTLGAGNTFSFVKPSAAAAAHANYAYSMDERMRWAQMADAMSQHNIYAVPLSPLLTSNVSLGQSGQLTYAPVEYMVASVAPSLTQPTDPQYGFSRTLSLPPQQRATSGSWWRPQQLQPATLKPADERRQVSTSSRRQRHRSDGRRQRALGSTLGPLPEQLQPLGDSWCIPHSLTRLLPSLPAPARRSADSSNYQTVVGATLYATTQTNRPEPMYGVIPPRTPLPLYASQPNLKGAMHEGPPSLNFTALRPAFAAHARRSMTPQPLLERTPALPPRGPRTPVPRGGPQELEDDRDERASRVSHPIPRPRSRGSMAPDFPTLSAHNFPLTSASVRPPPSGAGVAAGSQQPRGDWPGLVHLPWVHLMGEEPGEKSNSWRLAF